MAVKLSEVGGDEVACNESWAGRPFPVSLKEAWAELGHGQTEAGLLLGPFQSADGIEGGRTGRFPFLETSEGTFLVDAEGVVAPWGARLEGVTPLSLVNAAMSDPDHVRSLRDRSRRGMDHALGRAVKRIAGLLHASPSGVRVGA